MICGFCRKENDAEARFCRHCGHPCVVQDVAVQPAVLEGAFDVGTVTRLRDEKQRLSRQLNTMLVRAEGRAFTQDEERTWHEVYGEWRSVSDELTARVDYLSAREDRDRRQGERRQVQRRKQYYALDIGERRAGEDRREQDRRSGPDRRHPFPKTPSGETP
jgi:hypothetical protein